MLKQWIHQRRYQKQLSQLNNSKLSQYYQPPPINVGEQTFADSELLVLDFETTGLDPKKDRLLSVGFTTICNQRIQLGQSEHYLIQHTDSIPDETVAIHHITEEEAAQGQPITDIFPHLLSAMNGKYLVAHFADIEVGFLQQIATKHYQSTLPLIVIDTLQLAFRMKYKDAVHTPSHALNLFNLRKQYALPRYKAHNAMSDAVATAELLLILADEKRRKDDITIKQLIT